MSVPGDRHETNFPLEDGSWFILEIELTKNNPNVLVGLDRWLELGLISQAQIAQIARRYLSCTLPVAEILPTVPVAAIATPQSETEVATPSVTFATKPNVIGRLWQGFIDEISIRWLLFLGIFLVIVSSGVLAASQWQNFPRLGQYLILLVYTLTFWGIGFWLSRQENLHLTAQTLNAIAILLIPINCWAISHFGLGTSILEWITLLIALVVLAGIVYGQRYFITSKSSPWLKILFLCLSWLHLVWQLIPNPVWVIYTGIILVTVIHYLCLLFRKQYPLTNLIFWLVAWSLLLIRLIIFNQELIPDCSLAIAGCGWLISIIYLTKEKASPGEESQSDSVAARQLSDHFTSKICQFIAMIIFLATWSISILGGIFNSELYFWQTVGISVLGIHFFSQRLTSYWRKRDLTAVFLIGLQTLYISKELIPDSLRSNALDLAVTISKTEHLPESVLSVTLFPYIVLWVMVATWLYRRQQSELALHSEMLTLLLAMGLTYLSFYNPTWRSLNFFFSTITLGYVAWIRQPIRISLVYLTHCLGLVTILSGLQTLLPQMNQAIAASILVVLMAGEWCIYLRHLKNSRKSQYQADFWDYLLSSCWYFGLILAGLSYLGFASQSVNFSFNIYTAYGRLVWLVTPAMLTWVAKHTPKISQRRLATGLSCLGLVIAQPLVIEQPIPRAIALSIAIVLMFANSFHLRRLWVTVIHLGFGIGLVVSILASWVLGWYWLIVNSIIILGLARLQTYLQQTLDNPKFDYVSQRTAHGILGVGVEVNNYKLTRKYIQAADYWAIALIGVQLAILSLGYGNLLGFDYYLQYLLGGFLLLLAVSGRLRSRPQNLELYTLAWLIELLTVAVVSFLGGKELAIAVTNTILGLVAWGLIQQRSHTATQLNLSYIPLGYSLLAILWRLTVFNSYTGVITLVVAFMLLNTPHNQRPLAQITNYLGLAAISLGIYELVIYKMLQSSGGSAADGLTILALVAAAIAFSYRLTAWWYRQRQQTRLFNLNLKTVVLIAHIHWAISSMIKIMAAGIAIESTTPRLTPVSIATSFCLGAYAVIQGKDRSLDAENTKNDWWVYVGLVEIIATLVYSRLIISKLSLFDPWRIVITCAIALAIYQIPWQNFGWRITPWQRSAVITPALMALVTAEDISYFSLLVTAIFYLRIAYAQKNLRWSYLSLGFINWGIIRLIWQFNTELIWLAGVVSLSILYVAQFDPYFQSQYHQRHRLRIVGCSVVCIVALFYQDPGIIPVGIAFGLIFLGLGFRIRAFLFSGTIALILTAIYQLITLVVAYAFLKWVVGLVAGIFSIVVAAGFEKNRDRLHQQVQTYSQKLENWQ